MAKQNLALVASASGGNAAEKSGARVTYADLSAALRRAVDELRKPLVTITTEHAKINDKLKDFAPKVMRVFNKIKADNEAFSFVEFVRLYNPALPTHAAEVNGEPGYRVDKTYMSLDYMRRLVQAKPRGKSQGTRDTAADILARSIATILQALKPAEHADVWKQIGVEFGMSSIIVGKLQKRVEATEPLFKLRLAKAASIAAPIHMERAVAAAEGEGEGEEMQQRGRRVKVA